MSGPGKQYVIGKGRLFFNKLMAGASIGIGERYLGNSPELTSSISQDTLDHIDADDGLNVKDESITITNDLTGSFKLDSIENDNVAMWYGGDIEKSTIVAATAVVEPDFTAQRGLHYQLGTTEDTPSGTRKIDNVTASVITQPVVPGDPVVVTAIADLEANMEVDLDRARIYIEPDAPAIPNGTLIRVKYDQEGVTRTVTIGKGQEVRGALRFIAKNPVGENKDYFWPLVKITSNGDYSLKGDSWQEMSFNYEVLKKDASTERVYIDGVASV